MAIIEWVDRPSEAVTVEVAEPATEEKKTKATAAAKKAETVPQAEDSSES